MRLFTATCSVRAMHDSSVMRHVVIAAVLVAPSIGHGQPTDVDARRAVLAGSPRLDVSAGVGIEGFIGSELRDIAGPGPAWSVRAAVGNPESVRVELAYAGSRQPLSAIAGDGALTGHGARGLLLVNVYPEGTLAPYFFVGAGWCRYAVSGRAPGSVLAARDDVFESPFGVGVAYRGRRLVLDLRMGMRTATGPDLLPSADPSGSEDSAMMHRFGITAGIGYVL